MWGPQSTIYMWAGLPYRLTSKTPYTRAESVPGYVKEKLSEQVFTNYDLYDLENTNRNFVQSSSSRVPEHLPHQNYDLNEIWDLLSQQKFSLGLVFIDLSAKVTSIFR